MTVSNLDLSATLNSILRCTGRPAPVRERVTERLVETLLTTDALLQEIRADDSAAMICLQPRVERVYKTIAALVQQLAN